jgi:hypothetical protein
VKISVATSTLILVASVLRAKDVSGPDSVNGDEAFRVSVYGGPYDFISRVALFEPEDLRAQDRSGELYEGLCGFGSRRSRFWLGALGA